MPTVEELKDLAKDLEQSLSDVRDNLDTYEDGDSDEYEQEHAFEALDASPKVIRDQAAELTSALEKWVREDG